MKSITRKEAIEISRKIMEIAEKERVFMAELDAQKGIGYQENYVGRTMMAVINNKWVIGIAIAIMFTVGPYVAHWIRYH